MFVGLIFVLVFCPRCSSIYIVNAKVGLTCSLCIRETLRGASAREHGIKLNRTLIVHVFGRSNKYCLNQIVTSALWQCYCLWSFCHVLFRVVVSRKDLEQEVILAQPNESFPKSCVSTFLVVAKTRQQLHGFLWNFLWYLLQDAFQDFDTCQILHVTYFDLSIVF